VDEFGNVQLCSAQRGKLGKPVLEYTMDDVRAQARTHKDCEAGCALLCHYRGSAIDNDPLGSITSLVKMIVRRAPKVGAPTPPVVRRPLPVQVM
jgi:hypothetical protein